MKNEINSIFPSNCNLSPTFFLLNQARSEYCLPRNESLFLQRQSIMTSDPNTANKHQLDGTP